MSALDALQAALAAEHEVLHVYGVLGARTSASAAPALHAALVAGHRQHRSRRDVLRGFVRDLGDEPVASLPTYAVPAGPPTTRRLAEHATETEARSAAQMAALVAATSGAHRRWAATELTWSALARLQLGGTTETWPGAPELD